MFKKVAAAVALAASLTGSFAATTITTPDGVFSFGGFDWASNGSVWIQSYDVTSASAPGTSDLFTLRYQAVAANVTDANGANLVLPGLSAGNGPGYEFTISAVINERVDCVSFVGCSIVTLTPLSGSWEIRYQLVGNAAPAGITGVLDGTLLVSGSFTSGQTVISAQGPTNPGSVSLVAALVGLASFTDTTCGAIATDAGACIVPDLSGTEAVSTLQFGNSTTNWTRPGNWDGIGVTGPDTNTDFLGQADANQTFSEIPEPTTVALVGMGLLGAALARRRRR